MSHSVKPREVCNSSSSRAGDNSSCVNELESDSDRASYDTTSRRPWYESIAGTKYEQLAPHYDVVQHNGTQGDFHQVVEMPILTNDQDAILQAAKFGAVLKLPTGVQTAHPGQLVDYFLDGYLQPVDHEATTLCRRLSSSSCSKILAETEFSSVRRRFTFSHCRANTGTTICSNCSEDQTHTSSIQDKTMVGCMVILTGS